MASDTTSAASKPPMTAPELIAFVQSVLDADEEQQAKVAAATPTELPTGSTLDLSHKGIDALPVEVIILIKDKVERLALSHNRRIALPTEIAQCDRLRYLNLRWNKLEQFPEAVLSLSKLEILDISRNNIDVLPENIKKMSNLKYLALAKNQVRRLPLALGEMNLVKLKFDENPIEFPPPGALKSHHDGTTSLVDSEEKDMCQQVKRFMKAAALRERLKTNSEEDMSGSNVETPRPPKRGAHGGRFPVRPSISGIDNIPKLSSESPEHAPPIPQRSHARVASSTYVPPVKRPGITPLLTTGHDNTRSRSETVAISTNIRNRRQGYLGLKNSNLNSYSELSSQTSAQSNHTSALETPTHSRASSAASNYLSVGSGGESSSSAISPVDGSGGRAILSRKLASLPESRNSRMPTINSIKAVKRVLFMLFYIHRPLDDIARQLRDGTPKRTALERQLFSADTQMRELDRLIGRANNIVEDNGEIDSTLLLSIMRTAISALQTFGSAIKELSQNRQQAIKQVDAFLIRCVINTAYGTLVEARNVCHILGVQTTTTTSRNTIRSSQTLSSRTVTPTQPKSATSSSSGRRRGATILPSGGSTTSLRGIAPPVPLNSGSRSNTMTSISAATPRHMDHSTSTASASNVVSRTNALRSVMDDVDRDDPVEHAYATMLDCCKVATRQLDLSRHELITRKHLAEQHRLNRASVSYNPAIAKCDLSRAANKAVAKELPTVRASDPAQAMKLLHSMSKKFVEEWSGFVHEIKALNKQGVDVNQLRANLRPVQDALKNVSKAVDEPVPVARPPPSASLHGGFASSLNTALAQHTGYVLPVPATPLGAALGAAVQATVPPTPSVPTMPHNTNEYFPPSTSRRIIPDSVLPQMSYARR